MYRKGKGRLNFWFLNDMHSKAIVTLFISLIIMNLLFALNTIVPFPEEYDRFWNVISQWSIICAVFIPAAGGYVWDLLKKKEESELVEKFPDICIDRKEQMKKLEELISKNHVVVVTGESGSGKTTLLKKIESSYYKDNKYFLRWGEEVTEENEDIVVLDQFERALLLPNRKGEIEQVLKTMKKIIIGVRKEYLADVIFLLELEKQEQIFYLTYDEEDRKEIEKICEEVTEKTSQVLSQNKFFEKFTNAIKENEIPMIVVSYIWNIMIEERELEDVKELWEKNGETFEEMVVAYIENKLESLGCKEIAYPILYLLCEDFQFTYKNEIGDFKNITFGESKDIDCAVEQLKNLNLIREVNENKEPKRVDYEIAHEFLIEKIMPMCTRSISTEIRGNIEYYHINCQKKRSEQERVRDIEKYNNFHDEKNRRTINCALVILGMIIILVNAFNFFLPAVNLETVKIEIGGKIFELFSRNYVMMAIINAAVGLSMYYIYNYCYRFLIVFKKRYFSVVIVGGIVSILALVYTKLWAFFLGIEILFLGTKMYSISRQVRSSESEFFKRRGRTFCAIGVITLGLGIGFDKYGKGKFWLMVPFFGLYILYMLLGNAGHINKEYILMLLGKVSYKKGEELCQK